MKIIDGPVHASLFGDYALSQQYIPLAKTLLGITKIFGGRMPDEPPDLNGIVRGIFGDRSDTLAFNGNRYNTNRGWDKQQFQSGGPLWAPPDHNHTWSFTNENGNQVVIECDASLDIDRVRITTTTTTPPPIEEVVAEVEPPPPTSKSVRFTYVYLPLIWQQYNNIYILSPDPTPQDLAESNYWTNSIDLLDYDLDSYVPNRFVANAFVNPLGTGSRLYINATKENNFAVSYGPAIGVDWLSEQGATPLPEEFSLEPIPASMNWWRRYYYPSGYYDVIDNYRYQYAESATRSGFYNCYEVFETCGVVVIDSVDPVTYATTFHIEYPGSPCGPLVKWCVRCCDPHHEGQLYNDLYRYYVYLDCYDFWGWSYPRNLCRTCPSDVTVPYQATDTDEIPCPEVFIPGNSYEWRHEEYTVYGNETALDFTVISNLENKATVLNAAIADDPFPDIEALTDTPRNQYNNNPDVFGDYITSDVHIGLAVDRLVANYEPNKLDIYLIPMYRMDQTDYVGGVTDTYLRLARPNSVLVFYGFATGSYDYNYYLPYLTAIYQSGYGDGIPPAITNITPPEGDPMGEVVSIGNRVYYINTYYRGTPWDLYQFRQASYYTEPYYDTIRASPLEALWRLAYDHIYRNVVYPYSTP